MTHRNMFRAPLWLALALVLALPAWAQKDLSQMHGGTGGLWLPVNLQKYNVEEMKAMGLEIPVDSVYHPEGDDLSDAVVRLNGGSCTAEAVSGTGLLFTNHHCAFDMVAELSTEENDLLTNGFWAYERGEEIPLEGATASFLVRSEDVTERVLADPAQMESVIEAIEAEATEGTNYEAEVKPVFHGSEYYLFVYETFRDVRLAGIPPVAIGKYGYDQDNWVWPRHTGDFAILRVYANADNEPADYSEDNQPYQPRHHFPISIAGVEQGDYTMVLGYPGSTQRYLTSHAIEQEIEQNNPDRIELMGDVAAIMDAAMEADNADRIALESSYAGMMNAYKYYIGQNTMLQRYDIVGQKAEAEAAFQEWVAADPERQAEMDDLLSQIETLYEKNAPYERFYNHLVYSTVHPDVAPQGVFYSYSQLATLRQALASGQEAAVNEAVAELRAGLDDHFEGMVLQADKDIFVASFLNLYENLPQEMHPEIFEEIASGVLGGEEEETEEVAPEVEEEVEEAPKQKRRWWQRKNRSEPEEEAVAVAEVVVEAEPDMADWPLEDRVRAWVNAAYAEALATDRDRLEAFLAEPSLERLNADPLLNFGLGMVTYYVYNVARPYNTANQQLEGLQQQYLAALREMYPEKNFYPDANSTMRVSYGTVQPYEPRDGVMYDYYTTLAGAIEKENEAPEDPDFYVPPKLRELYHDQDYGPYGDEELVTCFITTCQSSGGSSGSPALNARGELVGILFDGNWEAMTSDIYPIPSLTRSIVVDARYVLFVIDKFAGAKNLIEELTIVNE